MNTKRLHANLARCLAHCQSFRVLVSDFSTKTPIPSSSGDTLYNRIQIIRDPRVSIVPVLNKWVEDGRTINKQELRSLVHLMRDFNRFNHALEISQWMSDQRYFIVSTNDLAVRLDLIYRVCGLEQAEKYFNNTSMKLKSDKLYGALLNIYVREKCVAKAEAIMQQMREMGPITSSFPYNMLINLYSQTGDHQKVDIVTQEMESLGIPHDMFTLRNRMSAYVLASDIPGMEKTLNRIEKDPNCVVDWQVYSLAASGYLKVELIEKALEMLKKMEGTMPTQRRKGSFQYLLSHYASTGRKDEVYRVWYKHKPGNLTHDDTIYSLMITSLAKLDDIEGAEEIFQEWESRCTVYDFRVLNKLLRAYCRKGLFDKAELAVEKATKNRTAYASTWHTLAIGYVEHKHMDKAVETLKRSLLVGRKGYRPSSLVLDSCLEYLEGKGDLERMKEIVLLLNDLGILTKDVYNRLIRAAVAEGKSIAGVLDQIELDGFTADDETCKIAATN